MSIRETTHRMIPKEQEIFDIGYAKGKADSVKHGHWIDYYHTGPCSFAATCSVCGMENDIPPLPQAHYCPSCGARMDGEE